MSSSALDELTEEETGPIWFPNGLAKSVGANWKRTGNRLRWPFGKGSDKADSSSWAELGWQPWSFTSCEKMNDLRRD